MKKLLRWSFHGTSLLSLLAGLDGRPTLAVRSRQSAYSLPTACLLGHGGLGHEGLGLAYVCLARVRKHPNLSLAIAAPEKHSDPSKVTWLLPSVFSLYSAFSQPGLALLLSPCLLASF